MCYSEDSMLSEINQSQKDKYCVIPPLEGTQSSQIHRVEWCCPGLLGGGNAELLFNVYKVSVLHDEKSSWLHNNVSVLNTSELKPPPLKNS